MKKFAVFALLAFAAPAVAEVTQAEKEFCVQMGDMAQNLMTLRQRGIPMSQLVGLIGEDYDKETKDLIMTMIQETYAIQMLQAQSSKDMIIAEFRNAQEYACYIAVSG